MIANVRGRMLACECVERVAESTGWTVNHGRMLAREWADRSRRGFRQGPVSLRPSVERLFSTTMQPCFNLADIPSHPLPNLAVFLHESDQVLRCGNSSVAGYGYRL